MSSIRPNRSSSLTHSRHSQTGVLESSSMLKRDEHAKIRGWIRELLRKYLAKYVRDFLSKRRDIVPSPVTSHIVIPDGNGNRGASGEGTSTGAEPDLTEHLEDALDRAGSASNLPDKGKRLAEKNLKMGLNISELTVMEETALGDDRITYLTKIASLGVKYSVAGRPDHFVHWLVKMPSKSFDEKNLARVTNVYSREVLFYSRVLQDIKQWVEINIPDSEDSSRLSLNVPTCYYAHAENSVDFDIDQDDDEEFPNLEFTLVLDDLRAQGFGKRHFSIGLTFEEAFEAVREIAKFHATCWAMGVHTGRDLIESWQNNLVKWQDLHSLYLDMIRQGFRNLKRFRLEYITEKTLAELVDSLLNLESKLPIILQNLLRPLPPPSVVTLVHMDLWTDNLLFREDNGPRETTTGSTNKGDSSTEQRKSNTSSNGKDSAGELDCMILDWQMVTVGRISHDLGILLITSLDGNVRRTYEQTLLKFYFESFEKIATCFKLEVPFDFSDLFAQYKDSCLLAILLSVTRLDLVVSEQSTLQRFFEALEDLRDLALI